MLEYLFFWDIARYMRDEKDRPVRRSRRPFSKEQKNYTFCAHRLYLLPVRILTGWFRNVIL